VAFVDLALKLELLALELDGSFRLRDDLIDVRVVVAVGVEVTAVTADVVVRDLGSLTIVIPVTVSDLESSTEELSAVGSVDLAVGIVEAGR